tara:strand:- start:876 stop:1298 length:423 start_codon:yes stop_codon:yes gene_type:complete
MAPNPFANIEEAFNHKVVKTKGCWSWLGFINGDGYGLLSWQMKKFTAHRVSYELHVGPIGKGLHVLHDCDNASCTNPKHLRLGTHRDNMDDILKRGNCLKKLTLDNIDFIQSSSLPVKQLAEMFNCSVQNIYYYKKRKQV